MRSIQQSIKGLRSLDLCLNAMTTSNGGSKWERILLTTCSILCQNKLALERNACDGRRLLADAEAVLNPKFQVENDLELRRPNRSHLH